MPSANGKRMQLQLLATQAFTPFQPVSDDAIFAGRGDQISRAIMIIGQPGQHGIIFGERGVGKTSLVNILAGALATRPDQEGFLIIAPSVTCTTEDTYSTLWRKVFQELVITERTSAAGFIKQTIEREKVVAEDLDGEVLPQQVEGILKEISANAVLFVIIDEFDRLRSDAARRAIADTIKSLSDHSVSATILLVGVADTVNSLIREHESVERALVQIQMPRLPREELEEIIQKGSERFGRLAQRQIDFEPAVVQRISLLSHGLPHYTHLLALYALQAALDADTPIVTIGHLDDGITKALENAQQSILSDYERATTSPHRESLFRQVLLACAMAETDSLGYFAPAAVRGPLTRIMGKKYEIPSFARHLSEFSSERRGPALQRIGTKHAYRFRFANPLMQPYVMMRGLKDGFLVSALLDGD